MDANVSSSTSTCLFCRLIREGRTVAVHGTMVAVEDRYPVTQGHLLVIPRRHTPDWFALTDREAEDGRALIDTLARTMRQRDPSISGFNIGTNVGVSAGQTVLHAHIHLIPRRDGDCSDPRGGVRGVIDGMRGY